MSIRKDIVSHSRPRVLALATGATAGAVVLAGLVGVSPANAAQPAVGLGTAASFGVLAGSTVTNTGGSVISGNLGVSPGTAITGFPPGVVVNGVKHSADALAGGAQDDLTTAYNSAAGRTPATVVDDELGGETLLAGVYSHASAMGLTGTVTLNAENDPAAVFIFKAGSTLITASNSTVRLINGAQPCNVFWQVGSSATLGTATTFVGTVMALTSASLKTGTTVTGRILARNGAVTLDSNVIRQPGCNMAWTPPGDDTTPDDDDGATGGGTGGDDTDSTGNGGDNDTSGGGGTTVTENSITPGARNTPGGNAPDGDITTGGDTPRTPTTPTPNVPRIPTGHPHTGLGGTS